MSVERGRLLHISGGKATGKLEGEPHPTRRRANAAVECQKCFCARDSSHFARLSVWGCTSKQRSGRFECILWSPCYLELNRPYTCCYILHIALQLRSLSIHPLANWVIQWLWYVLTPSTSVQFDSVADLFLDAVCILLYTAFPETSVECRKC